MNKPFLPEKETVEAQELIRDYPKASYAQLLEWTSKYEYKNVETFKDAVRRRYGVFRETVGSGLAGDRIEMPPIYLPPIKLCEYKVKGRGRGDEEEAILHSGDGHAGKITKSYDGDVYLQRMDTMFDSIMTIITLHRNMYPIRKLRIVNLGDNVQGENPFQGSKIGSVQMGERDQIAQLALPAWAKLICSLRQEFAEVEIEGFGGNHGHDKLAPETSRADYTLYDLLDAKLGDKKGIEVNIHERFGDKIDIMGFQFFCFHGDEIPCQQGVPFFALDKKLKSWHMQFRGFNYALGAHFHKRHSDEVSSRFEYFMTSTLVSDDDWALKKLGISSNPSQNLMGIHPRFGVTWRYPLVVDYQFLPEKAGDAP